MTGPQVDVTVVGAGVAGLVLTRELHKRGMTVALVETAGRTGGVIQTVHQDGFLLEIGPNSYTSNPQMDALVEDLGLAGKASRTLLKDRVRFVWKGGRLRQVPTSPLQFLTSDVMTMAGKLRLLRGVFGSYEPPTGDETMAGFFRRVIGDEAVESLLTPFLTGVYAADAERLSFEGTFHKLFEAVRSERKLLAAAKRLRAGKPKRRSPTALCSFADGLDTLPNALEADLRARGVAMTLDARQPVLRRDGDRWLLSDGDGGRPIRSRFVVLTCPADGAAEVLREVDSTASAHLAALPYTPLTVLHAGVEESQLAEIRNAFGFLSVRGQDVEALGMIWSSCIFPGRAPEGIRLLTCFYGGEKQPATNDWSDDQLKAALMDDLRKTMGYRGGTVPFLKITRWKRALPTFRLGHRGRLEGALAGLPQTLRVTGNYRDGVSMPNRVEAAQTLADQLKGMITS